MPLTELVDWIDWSPFFAAWEMRGAFPAILDDPQVRNVANITLSYTFFSYESVNQSKLTPPKP